MAQIDITYFRELIYQLEIIKGTIKLNAGFWPVWGNLITTVFTAFGSLSVAYLIFNLTKGKEIEFKKGEREKEDFLFRRKLFGEMGALHYDLIHKVDLLDMEKIKSQMLLAFMRIEPFLDYAEELGESNEKIRKLEEDFIVVYKKYLSNTSEYIFHKNNITDLHLLIDELANIGLTYKPEPIPVTVGTIQEAQSISNSMFEQYKDIWETEVKGRSNKILDCIRENR